MPNLPPPLPRSATLKLLGIGFLALLMLVPLSMLDDLRREREGRRGQAESALAASFGDAQQVGAPLLRVPVDVTVLETNGSTRQRRSWRYLVPDRVDAESSLEIEQRRRGIYVLPVYLADVRESVHFAAPRAALATGDGLVDWQGAELVIAVSDPHGLRELTADFDGVTVDRTEPVGMSPMGSPLFRIGRVDLEGVTGELTGKLRLKLAGSRLFSWMPLGRDFRASVQAPWPDPNFSGAFSPTRSEIGVDRSSASWQVLEFNSSLPSRFDEAQIDANVWSAQTFGLQLYQPADAYQRIERTMKYGLLVIGLTFGVFFLFETILRLRLHPVQYLLVGTALATFYLVLLAASEHLPFPVAYTAASAVLIAIVGGYAAAALRNPRHGLLIGGWLGLLFTTLYVLVGAEDYALLAGSGLVLALIAATMYLTRRIDWYAFGAVPQSEPITE